MERVAPSGSDPRVTGGGGVPPCQLHEGQEGRCLREDLMPSVMIPPAFSNVLHHVPDMVPLALLLPKQPPPCPTYTWVQCMAMWAGQVVGCQAFTIRYLPKEQAVHMYGTTGRSLRGQCRMDGAGCGLGLYLSGFLLRPLSRHFV